MRKLLVRAALFGMAMLVSSANAAVQSHWRDFGNSAKRLQSLDDRVRRDPCNVQLIQNAVLAIRDAGRMLDAAGEDTGLLPASFPGGDRVTDALENLRWSVDLALAACKPVVVPFGPPVPFEVQVYLGLVFGGGVAQTRFYDFNVDTGGVVGGAFLELGLGKFGPATFSVRPGILFGDICGENRFEDVRTKLEWLGTIDFKATMPIGTLPNQNWSIGAFAGPAWGHTIVTSFEGKEEKTQFGWTAGAGIYTNLDLSGFTRPIQIGLEARYYDLGTSRFQWGWDVHPVGAIGTIQLKIPISPGPSYPVM
jgi:opacity protein-like surface antigen